MKVEWIDYNKDFNEETSKELMKISDYILVKYIHTNSDKKIEHIGMLSFHKTADSHKIGILDGQLYYDYFKWTKILHYSPLEI
jgi:hypothetical protein